MTLPNEYLTRPHVIFDVESFGLHGDSFAVGAVLVKFELVGGLIPGDGKGTMRTLQTLAATERWSTRPWRCDKADGDGVVQVRGAGGAPIARCAPDTFNWLQNNIPGSVFEPRRLTGDLSIFGLFDAFIEAAGEDVMLWGEVPVPVEANFLNQLRANLSQPRREFWRSLASPLLHDVASLADPLGIPHDRVDMHKPAHDPLLDAMHSARRLCMALSKIVRLSEPDEAERRALIEHRFNGGVL